MQPNLLYSLFLNTQVNFPLFIVSPNGSCVLFFLSPVLQGNDVKAELKMLGKSLPAVFMEVVQAVSNDIVGESIEMYQAVISYAHSGSKVNYCPSQLLLIFSVYKNFGLLNLLHVLRRVLFSGTAAIHLTYASRPS